MFALPIMSISSNIPPCVSRACLTSEISCAFWRLPTLTSHVACVHSVCCCCSGHHSNSLSIISSCFPFLSLSPLSLYSFPPTYSTSHTWVFLSVPGCFRHCHLCTWLVKLLESCGFCRVSVPFRLIITYY